MTYPLSRHVQEQNKAGFGEVSNHELSRRHFVRIDFPTNEHAIKDLYDELETKLIQIGYKTGDAKQSIEVAESIGLQRTL